jgi:hypothetical protein
VAFCQCAQELRKSWLKRSALLTLPLVQIVVTRLHRRHIPRANNHFPLTLHDYAA